MPPIGQAALLTRQQKSVTYNEILQFCSLMLFVGLQNMNEGYKKMPISDPNDLANFIESTSGCICSILGVGNGMGIVIQSHTPPQGVNNVLYNNDPDDIPITDMDAAGSLPYDTDIPEVNK